MAAEGDAERLVVLLEARIRDFEKNMQKAGGTADKSYGRMQRGSRSATRQMEADMTRASRRVNQALASTSKQIGVLGRAFAGAFAGGMFVGGLAGLQRGVNDLVSEMSKIADTAKMIGTSAEDLQRLRFGFEQTGVAANATDTAMRRFARRIGEAANGSGQLYEVLKANNVQLRNADGSMRSQMELLRDYANLIKNAGSHQERLSLAFKAFDVAGADMVQALSNGADGLDSLMGKAEEAGGVIDEDLVKRAADLDTRWANAWRNFEINAKSGVLSAVTSLDDFLAKADEVANHSVFKRLAGALPTWGGADLTYLDPDLARSHGQELGPDARVRDAFSHALTEADEELVAELQKRYGAAAEKAQTTIIPGGKDDDASGGRNRAAEAAIREQEMMERRLEMLQISLMNEEEAERNSFANRLLAIQEFYDRGMLSQQELNELTERAQEEHAERMNDISLRQAEEDARNRQMLMQGVTSSMNALSAIIDAAGNKNLAAQKAFGVATSLINTALAITEVLKDPTLIGPARYAAVAKVAAIGAAQTASIMSTSKGGGGRGKGGGGGGASSAPAQPTQAMTVHLHGATQSTESVEGLLAKINEAVADGHKLIIRTV